MSTLPLVERDERTVAVENASYRWAYAFVTYALLIDVAYRGIVRDEAAWDLMAFVIAGGVFCSLYQARLKTLSHRGVKYAVLFACACAVVSCIIAVIVTWFRS